MKKNILLLLILIFSAASLPAQIITKSNKDKIGRDIKDGVNNALDAIQQDAHPSGTHQLWDGYVAPRLGLGISSLPGTGGRPELGAVAGVYFEAFVARNIGLSVEINFTHMGANHIYHASEPTVSVDKYGNVQHHQEKGRYDYNLDYINTLYLIHWYPWSYRPLSFYTGLQLSRLTSAKGKKDDGSKFDIEDDLFGGEFTIPIGVSYEWKQWEFDARYFISPRHIASGDKAKDLLGNARNMALTLSVAYKIQIF